MGKRRWRRVALFVVGVILVACQPSDPPPTTTTTVDGSSTTSTETTVPQDTTSTESTTTTTGEPPAPRPDLLFVKLDDASIDSLQYYMPETYALLHGEHWYDFSQAVVPTPLCGPERSTFLTGQQVDHHGMNCHLNGVTCPIWKTVRSKLLPQSLANAGVWVGWYGKVVNWTGECSGEKAIDGWPNLSGVTDYHALLGDAKMMYDKYSLIENGVLVKHDVSTGGISDYGTYYTASLVDQGVVDCTSPCALFWNPQAPHRPGTPAPDFDASRVVPGMPDYQPAYDEGCDGAVDPSITDKPFLLQDQTTCLPPLWRRSVDQSSLQAVDNRLPAMIESFLAKPGLKRIVLTSDHGVELGNHRHPAKETPYEMDVRVPLFIYDSENPGGSIDRLVNTRDLSATVLDWMGASTLITPTDSQSLVPLYTGASSSWGGDTYISHLHIQAGVFDVRPWRAVRQDCVLAAAENRHCLKVVRYPAAKVVRPDGTKLQLPEEREVYVLDQDPWELTNVYPDAYTGYAGVPGWDQTNPEVAAAFASLARHEKAGT